MYGLFRTLTPSQSVHSLLYGHFNGEDLVIFQRRSSIVFYKLKAEYIPEVVYTFNTHFSILKAFTYNPPGYSSTVILLLTPKYELLSLKLSNGRFKTKLLIDLHENGMQRKDSEPKLLVDPTYQLISFYGYKNVLKCILLNKHDYLDFTTVVNLRTNYDCILDFFYINSAEPSYCTNKLREAKSFNDTFNVTVNGIANAEGNLKPNITLKTLNVKPDSVRVHRFALAVLYQEEFDSRSHTCVDLIGIYFEVFNRNEDKIELKYILGYGYEFVSKGFNVDSSICRILPFPPDSDTTGMLFIGSKVIGYKRLDNREEYCQAYISHYVAEIDYICFKCILSDNVYLYYVSDVVGRVYLFSITIDSEGQAARINHGLSNLETIIPLVTLSPSLQLLSLKDDHLLIAASTGDSKILKIVGNNVVDVWNSPSFSPIVDGALIPGRYSDQLVVTSGLEACSNVSVVDLGCTHRRVCSLPLPSVIKIFALQLSHEDTLVVVVTLFETCYFKLSNNVLKLLEKSDKILYITIHNNCLCKIIDKSLYVSSKEDMQKSELIWSCIEPILHACSYDNNMLVYSSAGLYLVDMNSRRETALYAGIAPVTAIALAKAYAFYATVDNRVHVVDLRGGSERCIELSSEVLDVIASDIVFMERGDLQYLFVGLTDGSVAVYLRGGPKEGFALFMQSKLSDSSIHFVSRIGSLYLVSDKSYRALFAKTGRIMEFQLLEFEPLNDLSIVSESLLLLASRDSLELVSLPKSDLLNVKRISLHTTVDLVEYHKPSNCLVIALPESGLFSLAPTSARVSIINLSSGLEVATLEFDKNFEASSLGVFDICTEHIVFIGASSLNSDVMPSRGQLYSCRYSGNSFTFNEIKIFNDKFNITNGGVLNIKSSKSYLFVAINNSLVVFRPNVVKNSWNGELVPLACYSNFNMIIDLDIRDSLILATDISRGLTLLRIVVDKNSNKIEEVARDIDLTWCCCSKLLDENYVLAFEINGDAVLLMLNKNPINTEQYYLLKEVGRFYLGEPVNKVISSKGSYYAWSATGAIYEFKFIDLARFAPLHIFEKSVRKVLAREEYPDEDDYHNEFFKGSKNLNFVNSDFLYRVFELDDGLVEDIVKESNAAGYKYNYAFNVSHLLKWKYLDYNDVIDDYTRGLSLLE